MMKKITNLILILLLTMTIGCNQAAEKIAEAIQIPSSPVEQPLQEDPVVEPADETIPQDSPVVVTDSDLTEDEVFFDVTEHVQFLKSEEFPYHPVEDRILLVDITKEFSGAVEVTLSSDADMTQVFYRGLTNEKGRLKDRLTYNSAQSDFYVRFRGKWGEWIVRQDGMDDDVVLLIEQRL